MTKRKHWEGRIYLGRSEGKQTFKWIGRFPTRRERDQAVAKARVELASGQTHSLPVCDAYVGRYLAEYERRHKWSSYLAVKQQLSAFRKEFADRPLDSIARMEAKDWAATIPQSYVPAITAMFNYAIDDDDLPLTRNPFRKLANKSKGRAELPPPTEEEFERLLEACAALGSYASMMRALTKFAAFTLMRPSELYELEWADVDFEAMRIHKARRFYRGTVDIPKTGPRLIALTQPARDAILGLPRTFERVFSSKEGKRLRAELVSPYWAQVRARAKLDFDFYHATKHYGVWYLWTKLGLSPRAIATQAGWSLRTVDSMLSVYGHAEIGALEEVDAAFREAEVVQLRDVKEGDLG